MKGLPYYNSIKNIPIHSFDELQKGGDNVLKHLWKDPDNAPKSKKYKWYHHVLHFLRIKRKINLVEIWQNIYDEYINTFGWSNKFDVYILITQDANNLLAQYVATGDRSRLSLARSREAEAQALIKSTGEVSLAEMSAAVTKHMGIKVDIMKDTAYQFYSYVKLMSKSNG